MDPIAVEGLMYVTMLLLSFPTWTRMPVDRCVRVSEEDPVLCSYQVCAGSLPTFPLEAC